MTTSRSHEENPGRERSKLEEKLANVEMEIKQQRERPSLSQGELQKGKDLISKLHNELSTEKEKNEAGLRSLKTAAESADRRIKELEGYMARLPVLSAPDMYAPRNPASHIPLPTVGGR